MTVSKRLRFEILRRDNHTCRYCGATAPNVTLQVDHVTAKTLGGTDHPTNLVTACSDCNSGKSATILSAPTVEDISTHTTAWHQAKLTAAQEHSAARERLATVSDALQATWVYTLPSNFRNSIRAFLAAGLDEATILEMAEVAQGASGVNGSRWNYFCGCCWKRARQIEDAAAAITGIEASPRVGGLRLDDDKIRAYWDQVNTRHRQLYEGDYSIPECECGSEFCGGPLCQLLSAKYHDAWLDAVEMSSWKRDNIIDTAALAGIEG
ncbi:hypothetical protein GCM10007304_18080 [Rhodococcoides trifolii]|uniref:HNH nuclease domain-containing protein n=1 Tax=Rhodococcoides trifolii TaxID=908250 RepID=A0A917FV83_9NOCA|nr:HNH endonuclease [Rhodococcus trifolii]GGG04352.1 hypothetical protein GCM10007304_18080 [Rhodococcus trifolii]